MSNKLQTNWDAQKLQTGNVLWLRSRNSSPLEVIHCSWRGKTTEDRDVASISLARASWKKGECEVDIHDLDDNYLFTVRIFRDGSVKPADYGAWRTTAKTYGHSIHVIRLLSSEDWSRWGESLRKWSDRRIKSAVTALRAARRKVCAVNVLKRLGDPVVDA